MKRHQIWTTLAERLTQDEWQVLSGILDFELTVAELAPTVEGGEEAVERHLLAIASKALPLLVDAGLVTVPAPLDDEHLVDALGATLRALRSIDIPQDPPLPAVTAGAEEPQALRSVDIPNIPQESNRVTNQGEQSLPQGGPSSVPSPGSVVSFAAATAHQRRPDEEKRRGTFRLGRPVRWLPLSLVAAAVLGYLVLNEQQGEFRGGQHGGTTAQVVVELPPADHAAARPTFRWTPAADGPVVLRLLAQGQEIWSAQATSSEHAWPSTMRDLEPGTYTLQILGQWGGSDRTLTHTFTVTP